VKPIRITALLACERGSKTHEKSTNLSDLVRKLTELMRKTSASDPILEGFA